MEYSHSLAGCLCENDDFFDGFLSWMNAEAVRVYVYASVGE